jgi:phage shock protein PspC (stress-responsive transcriptional regulator)
MNKTVTVNIGGMVFHIDEHAYELLNNYLRTIRSHFTMSDGRDEIIQDIEGRIAEIFQQKLLNQRHVITLEDVNEVMAIMGKPEDIGGTQEHTAAANEIPPSSTHVFKRKLYRDPDDRVIAGVCSGISHRLNIDAVWVRLIFAFVLFFGGTGFFLYLILAFILPKAETTAQKLEMRGEPVNINTIRKESNEQGIKKEPSFISGFFDTLGLIIKFILKIVIYFFGFLAALVGVFVLLLIALLFMAMLGVSGLTIPIFISNQFLTGGQQFWAMTSIVLLIVIPLIWILYHFIKWIFKIQHSSRPFNILVGCLFLAGIITTIITSVNIAREFTQQGKIRNTVELLNPTASVMMLKLMDDPKYDEDNNFKFFTHNRGNLSVTTGSDLNFRTDNVSFTVQKATGDKFELVQIFSAKGSTEKAATESAQKIIYNFEQRDSMLLFSDRFPIPKGSMYRDQHVKLILKVPVGKSIYLDESMEEIIHDIENISDTYDGDMGGHTWRMTDAGLECTDYHFSDNKNSVDHDSVYNTDNLDIKIDENGVRINGVDKNDANAKDVKININKNGIRIKSKNK